MRIIGGHSQRRLIKPPRGLPVRPTTDKAKEGLFNILNNVFDFGAVRVLDLFAGTGSISYEFASRGAVEVVAVEKHPACVRFIRQVKTQFSFDQLMIVRADAFRFLLQCRQSFDIVFADPPYGLEEMGRLPDLVFSRDLISHGGMLIIEHSSDTLFDKHPCFVKKRNYSRVTFSFFEPA